MSEEDLEKMIGRLYPNQDLFTGRKFFQILLKRGGPEAVLSFIEKASIALDKGDGVDLSDFNDLERDAFNSSRVNYMSRRAFFGVACVGVAGVGFTGQGVVGTAKWFDDHDDNHGKPKTQISKAHDFVLEKVVPVAEILIGPALVNEAYDKKMEIKLKHIAYAIEVLQAKMEKESKSVGVSR